MKIFFLFSLQQNVIFLIVFFFINYKVSTGLTFMSQYWTKTYFENRQTKCPFGSKKCFILVPGAIRVGGREKDVAGLKPIQRRKWSRKEEVMCYKPSADARSAARGRAKGATRPHVGPPLKERVPQRASRSSAGPRRVHP